MTPKEKAIELINKYQELDIELSGKYDGYLVMKLHDAKDCSLIAVDEIIDVCNELDYEEGKDLDYWHQVKAEIEKL